MNASAVNIICCRGTTSTAISRQYIYD